MTTDDLTSPPPPHAGLRGTVWTLLTLAAAAVTAHFALALADGVTFLGGTSYDTEFVDVDVWSLGFLLVVPVFLAVRANPWVMPAALLAASWPQFSVASTTVERYVTSGWADGLESLAYVQPVLMTGAYLLAAGLAVVLARRQRAAGRFGEPSRL